MADKDIAEIARQHGFSEAAAREALRALHSGGGMAQFNHPELGGYGQWMPGMVMVGDMFNTSLKARVDALCTELAGLAREMPEARAAGDDDDDDAAADTRGRGDAGRWWPAELGAPAAAGAQGGVRYAYFAAPRRLAIEEGKRVTVYDTADHQIHGVSQQQGTGPGGVGGVVFTSQHGTVPLDRLTVVERR